VSLPLIDQRKSLEIILLNPSKKQAKSEAKIHPFSNLFSDCILIYMTQFMGYRELLAFSTTAKRGELMAKYRWKTLRLEEHYLFSWSDCLNEVDADKWNFILGAALCESFEKRWFYQKDQVKKFRQRFSHLVERFPNFGHFFNSRLLSSAEIDYQENKRQIREAMLNMELKEGGDYLLKGLYGYYQQSEGWQDLLKKAIEHRATVVSIIAIEKIKLPHEVCVDLAIKAADQKDFRALDYMKKNYIHIDHVFTTLYQAGYKHGPICAHLALIENDLVKAHRLCDEALISYGDAAPAHVVLAAAKIKTRLLNSV